jgi:hypothetical protein
VARFILFSRITTWSGKGAKKPRFVTLQIPGTLSE